MEEDPESQVIIEVDFNGGAGAQANNEVDMNDAMLLPQRATEEHAPASSRRRLDTPERAPAVANNRQDILERPSSCRAKRPS